MTDRKTADSPELQVEVQVACSRAGVPDEDSLCDWADRAYRAVGQDSAIATIRVTEPGEIRTLNRNYRGYDHATNVLSFNIDSPVESGARILGDIIVCRDVVLDEAREQNKDPRAHWAHMIAHGVLHLCGYDHEQVADAAEMESLETKILATLGFPNPH